MAAHVAMAQADDIPLQPKANDADGLGQDVVQQVLSMVKSQKLKVSAGDVIRVINLDGSLTETTIELPQIEIQNEGGDQAASHEEDAEVSMEEMEPTLSYPELRPAGMVPRDQLYMAKKEFACDVCNKKLSSAASYAVHMRIHTGEKPFKCAECGASFARKAFLCYHMRLHTGKNPYVCKCGAELSSGSSYSRHMKRHDEEKPFQCHLCSAAFIQRPHYKEHLRKHSGKPPFWCQKCNACFLSSSGMRLHQNNLRHHAYNCSMCHRGFGDQVALCQHQLKHHDAHTATAKQGGKPSYNCNVCGVDLSDRELLIQHLDTHAIKTPIECRECYRVYTDLSQYVDHRSNGLCVDEEFKCSCGLKYHKKDDLVKHMETHVGYKEFPCNRCTVVFTRPGDLAKHMDTHTGMFPFKCPVCRASYIDKHLFTKHFNSHSETTDVPVRCSICRDRCKSQEQLKAHMTVFHKRYLGKKTVQ